MIDFEGYYSFPADQVESVEIGTRNDAPCPYILSVNMKSGKTLSVNYKNKADRDRQKQLLVNRISTELRSDYERLYNKLYLIEDCMKRVDKRQLRIWRQLKTLLHLTVEDIDE